MNIEKVVKAFGFEELVEYAPVGEGHIHSTYRITVKENGGEKRHLLQQVNTYVFKNPVELMENIKGITSFLAKKITEAGGDASRETLQLLDTADGRSFYTDDDGLCWRCYNYIENAYSLEEITCPEESYRSAKAFGTFSKLLADYPIDSLHETIVNFHNTVSRFADFKKAYEDDISGRVCTAKEEAEFFFAREKDCGVLLDLLKEGKLPLRVTHNDTKLNNVMFDKDTDRGLCVVDLDTVMPGLSLYDFGDAVRFSANTATEDERDLSKVSLSLEYFEAYVRGYLEAAGDALTDAEIEYLPFASKLLTLECGMRFLGDYFNGDVYFKISAPDGNLVRARTQISLVADMEKKMDEMKAIVAKCRKELDL